MAATDPQQPVRSRSFIPGFMRLFVTLILIAALTAACDVVTSRYETYGEAVADSVFGRGWLPDKIPRSSYEIEVNNDLDINTSTGDFRFSLDDLESFVAILHLYEGGPTPFSNFESIVQKRKKNGYDAYWYSERGCTWIFFINNSTGHVFYDMWLLRDHQPQRTIE